MRKNDTYVILLVTNQSGCDYSFLATIGFIAPDKKMINSRHTGMIIWIIKILRRLYDTFYKQNALSLAFRQRVGVDTFKKTNPEPVEKSAVRDF